jgi:hypothetical protein
MKKIKLIGLLMILTSSLMFIQCTSDPIEGPQGLAGIDGTDGTDGSDGVDGVNGTASCVACHNESHRTPIEESYAKSGHAAGANVAYTSGAGRASCGRCHNNEGYINYITGKPAVEIAITNAKPVSCTTCHSKHSTFDFENDGHDYALRNIDPVKLDLTDVSYVVDYGNSSNNCVSCHQARSKAPVDTDNDGLYLQANSRFYPHYSGQSTFLEGIQGAVIANGSTAIPAVGSAAHRTGASCVSCHMSATTNGTTGLHTFKVSTSACTSCHTTVPTEVAGLAADMATLHDKLFALGLITADGSTVVQTTNVPFKTAQALWNYKTVEEDHSHGIHNPNYAKALIKNALQAVN